jgi:hypothetical protein
MNSEMVGSVDEALARLPRELSPARDLWPAIAQSMHEGAPGLKHEPRPVRWPQWPVALAASLGLMGLVAALSWSVLRQPATTAVAQGSGAVPSGQTMVSFEAPQNAAFLSARAALESTYEQRLALLAPATRARVRSDLETIRKANADIRDALIRDPASPLLLQLLRSTWQQ